MNTTAYFKSRQKVGGVVYILKSKMYNLKKIRDCSDKLAGDEARRSRCFFSRRAHCQESSYSLQFSGPYPRIREQCHAFSNITINTTPHGQHPKHRIPTPLHDYTLDKNGRHHHWRRHQHLPLVVAAFGLQSDR